MNSVLALCALASILDRGGIPSSLLIGLAVCDNDLDRQLFLAACVLASFVGDILFYHLGRLIEAQKEELGEKKRKLRARAVHLSRFVQGSPSVWMFCARAFPVTNQIIPLALGVQRYSWFKTYLSSFLGGLCWMTLFFYGFDLFLSLERFNHLATIVMGAVGLIAIAVAMKRLDRSVFTE